MTERRPRMQRLSRERILETALMIADAEGLQAVSMRKIAAELGTGAMSLYNHVPDKAALLEGLAELVLGEVEVPAGAKPRAICETWTRTLRAAIAAHSSLVPIILAPGRDSPVARLGRSLVAGLTGAGVSSAEATNVVRVLGRWVAGSVLFDAGVRAGWQSAREHSDKAFELGLAALLDGLSLPEDEVLGVGTERAPAAPGR